MSDVLVGATLPQFTDDRDRFIAGATRAEELGLDSLWLFDHLWPLSGGKERPIVESWTALGWLAAATDSIRIGTLVTRSTLRHPAVLAKMAMTVAVIAPGRVTVAIGSGDELSRAENAAFGLPYHAGDARVGQLLSTVRAVHGFFRSPAVTLTDDFISVSDLPATPAASPPPQLWVGGRADDLLEIAGLIADGWNGWGGSPSRFAQDAATVAGFAGERAVELSWGGQVMIAGTDDEAAEKMGNRERTGWIVGGPARVADALCRFVDAGARHLVVTVPDPWRPGIYELIADVRERVTSQYP